MIARNSQSGHVTYGLQEFTIDTEADVKMLPLDIPVGSAAFCVDTGDIYILNGNREWKIPGGSSSPSGGGVSKEYVDTQVATKQDILHSGENIKTINNESILGEGNIDVSPDIIVNDGTNDYKVTFQLIDGNPVLVTTPLEEVVEEAQSEEATDIVDDEGEPDRIPESDWNEPVEAEPVTETEDATELPDPNDDSHNN